MSAARKKEMWERWKAGESVSDIARALDKKPGSIFGTLKAGGGALRRPGGAGHRRL